MAACVTCGTNLVAGAVACGGCGEPLTQQPSTGQLPRTATGGQEKVFALITKAGGTKFPNKNLTLMERVSVYTTINLGSITGMFYYLYHKMFKKLAVYIPVGLVFGTMIGNPFGGVMVVCIFRANIDMYKEKIEKNTGWW